MFQFKRKQSAVFTKFTQTEYTSLASQVGPFEALLEALRGFQPGPDSNWLLSEIMQAYPDPNIPAPELHLLMGLYLEKTDAPLAAQIEYQRAGSNLVNTYLPSFHASKPSKADIRPAQNEIGLLGSDLSDQDADVQLNEFIEAWALSELLRTSEEQQSSQSSLPTIFTGLLTAKNFPESATANLRFFAVSIADEKILNPRRLGILQQAAPVLVRDSATQTLLDYFEVPNFLIGPPSSAVSFPATATKPNSSAWIAIEQWANDEITKFDATELLEKPHQLQRSLKKVLKFENIKTSIPAIAQIGIGQNKQVEFKPKPKLRPFVTKYPKNPIEQSVVAENYATVVSALLRGEAEFTAMILKLMQNQFAATIKALPSSSLDTTSAEKIRKLRTTLSSRPKSERHLHLAFGFDRNLLNYFEPVLQEIQDNASFSADIYVLGRGFNDADLNPLVEKFPFFSFHFFPFDTVDYGSQINTLEHITVSTMDRLLLAELLPEVEQLIYLDTDLMVFEDLWEIGKIKLGHHALGARLIKTAVWGSAYKTFHKAAAKLPLEFVDDLRTTLIHNHHLLETKMVNAGVLIMNLKLMRSEKFLERFVGLVEYARFNDQDVLSLWAAGRIVELETAWNWTVSQTEIVSPKIIHWAGPRKPWQSDYVWYQPEFYKYLSNATPLA